MGHGRHAVMQGTPTGIPEVPWSWFLPAQREMPVKGIPKIRWGNEERNEETDNLGEPMEQRGKGEGTISGMRPWNA